MRLASRYTAIYESRLLRASPSHNRSRYSQSVLSVCLFILAWLPDIHGSLKADSRSPWMPGNAFKVIERISQQKKTMESRFPIPYNADIKEGFLHEKPQILGVGCRDLYDYDILHRLQTQISEGGTVWDDGQIL